MKHTSFIARRYLFSRKHISLISTLTVISIVGITIGTALLIVVLSVFNGFFDVIKGILLSYDPDLRIESAEGKNFHIGSQELSELQDIPEIKFAAPYVEGKALMVHRDGKQSVITVKGVDKNNFFKINEFQQQITKGVFELGVKDGSPGILVGNQTAGNLNLSVNDEVMLLSAAGMEKVLTQFTVPRSYRFDIRGVYSITRIMGEPTAFVDIQAAQHLFDTRNRISGIDISTPPDAQAADIKKTLQSKLGPEFTIQTWYELQKPLYDVMYLEKWGAFLILMLIVLVAVLNIVGSLMMIVIQKNRDIGILRSFGFTPSDIKSIFLKQGFYIGLIGCGIGGGLGLLVSWLQMQYGLIKLSSSFIISAYPVSIRPTDIAVILLGSLLCCIVASWFPAMRASRVEPAEAIRYE